MARRSTDPATARLLATVASESRPYTDPQARYPRAVQTRQARADGAARRPPPLTHPHDLSGATPMGSNANPYGIDPNEYAAALGDAICKGGGDDAEARKAERAGRRTIRGTASKKRR